MQRLIAERTVSVVFFSRFALVELACRSETPSGQRKSIQSERRRGSNPLRSVAVEIGRAQPEAGRRRLRR